MYILYIYIFILYLYILIEELKRGVVLMSVMEKLNELKKEGGVPFNFSTRQKNTA